MIRCVGYLSVWLLAGCGTELTMPEHGVGDGMTVTPAETAQQLQGRPKCDLPAPEKMASLHGGAIANTRIEALEGFESVNAVFEEVAKPMPDVRACTPKPFTQRLTNAPSYRLTTEAAAPYQHLTHMTFVPDRRKQAPTRARGDLYLHGEGDQALHMVLRDVDFRKYLYQEIVLYDCESSPDLCDSERLPGKDNIWKGAEKVATELQNVPFNSDTFQCIRNVHGYFAEFNRITKKISEKTSKNQDSNRLFHLTNNCREPGNYELALIGKKEGKQWKNHVSLDIDFYGQILAEIAVDYQKLGTGRRIVGTSLKADGTYAYDTVEQKAFPSECHIQNLAPYVGKAQRLLTAEPTPVARVLGEIPWEKFASETNAKSGRAQDEGIVYVEVSPDRSPPKGFAPPEFHFETDANGSAERINHQMQRPDWATLQGRATATKKIHAPHTFHSFGDVLAGPFSISAFEVDGRYLGRVKDAKLQSTAQRMYSFDYSFLSDLKHYEVREAIAQDGSRPESQSRLEFRFLDDGCAESEGSCVNLVVGNIQLEPGEETRFVLGIGTQPLRDLYENNAYQEIQQYALTYNENGHITELVSKHGLGMVYVRRGQDSAANAYTVDFVSYERAAPLWRGLVRIPE